jgi:hypothetical protein
MTTLTLHDERPRLQSAPPARVTKRHAAVMLLAALAAGAAVYVAAHTDTAPVTAPATPAVVVPAEITGLDGLFNGVGVNTPTAVEIPDLAGLNQLFDVDGFSVPA